MTSNSRFDLSTSSPDGPTYSNGQRGSYSAASLEKLGGFCESSDRILSSPSGTLKSNATPSSGDLVCLLQPLASDLKVVVADLRTNRPGDMKRAINSIFGASADDTLSLMFGTKPLPSCSLDEIKRLKNNLQDNFTKARDRAKYFGDASMKIDKFAHNIMRKRSRADSLLGERPTGLCQGGISKVGPQNHLSGCALEIGPQRLDEKSKISAPNKRIRTSLVDMDAHVNGISKTCGFLERDKDISKAINGSGAHVDENDRAFSAIVDGWERSKMKKKRSVIKSDLSASAGLVKFQSDRETKRGAPHKIGIDGRPKLSYSQSFRSGSNNNTTLAGKSDLCVQQTASSMRSRNEQTNASISNDKKDARFCLDSENPPARAISKPNGREDCRAASPTLSKIGSARGPRSNSGSLLKTSPIIHRMVGNTEDIEPPQALGAINRKRSASVRSSSPPVVQWAVQRPQKIPRSSRRSSLSPLISTHDALSVSETMEDAPINHDDFGGTKRSLSSNASQHSKIRGDNFVSSLLSESEESDLHENKLREKVKKFPEIEGKPGENIQKFTNLIMPTRKNRVAAEEDCGDIDRRQGRAGRGFAPSRSSMSASTEKLGDVVTTKQQRSVRHGSERAESKPGRPPIKKFSERRSYVRPRQLVNNLSLEFSDEAADDREELVASANAALDTGWRCSGSFWKKAEPLFSFVSANATAFLREQIQITNESTARTNDAGDDSQSIKIDEENALLSSATVVTARCESNAFSKDTADFNPLEQCMSQSGSYSGISICQALLSAIIGEDDMDDIYNKIDYGDDYSYNDLYTGHFMLDKGLKTKGLNLQPQGNQTAGRSLDYYKVDASWRFCDELFKERSKPNTILETVNRPFSTFHQDLSQLAPNQTTTVSSACTELQYNQMSINDRILLELSEIGLYPEHVPGLYGEDEDITKNICALEQKLQEQAANRRNLLLKLEKIVVDAKELQLRKFEHLAMDHVMKIAYDRYLSCWGPGASGSKNMSKLTKLTALSFIKRTLARCKKYEETSISCFSEPFYRDIFFSASSRNSDLRVTDIPIDTSQITTRVHSNSKLSNSSKPMEFPFCKEEVLPNCIKKKEVLLDDVVGSSSGLLSAAPNLGSSLFSSTKGKRSERDRDGKVHGQESGFKNSTTKIGRPAAPICKGERKNKTKPKAKTSQLSASANALHSKAATSSAFPDRDAQENQILLPNAGAKKLSNENDPIDLSNLQLPDMDAVDFGGQGQDIISWLNFDDDGLQDHGDFVGLEIPMDDLSEVHMMI